MQPYFLSFSHHTHSYTLTHLHALFYKPAHAHLQTCTRSSTNLAHAHLQTCTRSSTNLHTLIYKPAHARTRSLQLETPARTIWEACFWIPMLSCFCQFQNVCVKGIFRCWISVCHLNSHIPKSIVNESC